MRTEKLPQKDTEQDFEAMELNVTVLDEGKNGDVEEYTESISLMCGINNPQLRN